MLQSLPYLLRILSQIENRCHQNPRWVRLVENPVRKPLHDLSPHRFKVARGYFWKDSDPGQIGLSRRQEFYAKSLLILFETVENPL